MSEDEPIPPGLAKLNEVYGWDSPDFPGEFFRITRDHLFGEIWTRPGLDTAQRRLLLIGLMVGRGLDDVLEIQLRSAYKLGELDEQQLREIVIFLAHYAGWPSAASLNGIVEKIIATERADA
jgi:4-carboxymuconolactone decarboxylase